MYPLEVYYPDDPTRLCRPKAGQSLVFETKRIPQKIGTDLQLKGIGDETVKYSKWRRKTELHTLARRSYQSDKPEEDDNWWKLSGARADISKI